MSPFPEILPADPCAPEQMRNKPRKLKYGVLGRLFLVLDAAAESRQMARTSDRLLRDVGLVQDDARRDSARPFWDLSEILPASGRINWRDDVERVLTRPGVH